MKTSYKLPPPKEKVLIIELGNLRVRNFYAVQAF